MVDVWCFVGFDGVGECFDFVVVVVCWVECFCDDVVVGCVSEFGCGCWVDVECGVCF